MKKAGLITIALILVAAGVILYYRLQGGGQRIPGREQGTMVQRDVMQAKEQVGWKRYCM